MMTLEPMAEVVADWLAGGVLDGTLFAGVAWLVSVTVLRRSSGRALALLWLAVLVEFMLQRPVRLPTAAPLVGVPAVAAGSSHGAWLLVYGTVVVCSLARLLVRQHRLRRRVHSFRLAEPAVMARLHAAAAALSLRRLPEVRITDGLVSPFALGPGRPSLVLPSWLCVPGPRLDAVLLHELAHLQRRDHLLLWLQRAVACLFFFWPPVHWACRRLDEARELACDELAIERGGFQASEYGEHLLAVATMARGRWPVGAALAIGHGASRLEQRIDRLLLGAPSRRWSWWQASALLPLALCAVLGLPPAKGRERRLATPAPSPASAVQLPEQPSGELSNSLMSIDSGQLSCEPQVAVQGCASARSSMAAR